MLPKKTWSSVTVGEEDTSPSVTKRQSTSGVLFGPGPGFSPVLAGLARNIDGSVAEEMEPTAPMTSLTATLTPPVGVADLWLRIQAIDRRRKPDKSGNDEDYRKPQAPAHDDSPLRASHVKAHRVGANQRDPSSSPMFRFSRCDRRI